MAPTHARTRTHAWKEGLRRVHTGPPLPGSLPRHFQTERPGVLPRHLTEKGGAWGWTRAPLWAWFAARPLLPLRQCLPSLSCRGPCLEILTAVWLWGLGPGSIRASRKFLVCKAHRSPEGGLGHRLERAEPRKDAEGPLGPGTVGSGSSGLCIRAGAPPLRVSGGGGVSSAGTTSWSKGASGCSGAAWGLAWQAGVMGAGEHEHLCTPPGTWPAVTPGWTQSSCQRQTRQPASPTRKTSPSQGSVQT